MLIDQCDVCELLRDVVQRLTNNLWQQQDLMQEALVHLWLREARYPGQTKSWYLQSCRFHLQHYMDSGRSVDSVKRRGHQIPLLQNEDGDTPLLEPWTTDNGIFSQISAHELLTILSQRLTPREKAILDCLADGLGAREIARKLNISHPTAIKSRRKIAKLVIELGIASSAPQQTTQPRLNGTPARAASPVVNGSRQPVQPAA